MSDKTSIGILAALSWILIALAAVTVVPFTAPKLNDLGYYSLCSFTPWSTLALLMVAGVAWAIRKYLVTRIR
jgi:hypothetical protein